MAKSSNSKGWWKTLPGMLTATAGAITAVTGLIVALNQIGLIGRGGESSNTTKGVWLEIKGVEVFGRLANGEVQVTGIVNGTEYRYPSLEGVQWLKVGPDMSPQRFSLPRSKQYRVRFKMLVRRGRQELTMISQKEVIVDGLPFEGRYKLHRKVGGSRAANVEATIHYVITTDPD